MGKKKTFVDSVIKTGAAVGLAGLLLTVGVNSKRVEINDHYNSIINSTKNSVQFQEFKKAHEVSLVDTYKRGEITGQELSTKLATLEASEFVYESRDSVMTESTANKIEELHNDNYSYGLATASSATATVAGGLVALIANVIKEKSKRRFKGEIDFGSDCMCSECTRERVMVSQDEFEL